MRSDAARQVEPLQERGARELKRATRAFNAMQERLNRYLDSRTRVLAAMSHDLRTPITRLRLRVESIEDEALRARCVEDLDEMTRMVSGALSLFRGLNDDEAAVAVDINALLDELQRRYGEINANVTIDGRAAAPFSGKPLALKRCLGNLVDNALQYGGNATIAVTDSDDELTIRVLDDGPGIPEAELDRVFEPFYRLESSRNRATGGTGLGLSIARDVAQAHGGSLTLANRSSGGLEAKLVLPRLQSVTIAYGNAGRAPRRLTLASSIDAFVHHGDCNEITRSTDCDGAVRQRGRASRSARRPAGPDMDRMAILLDLNDSQKAEVQKILGEQHEKVKAAHEEKRAAGTKPTREERAKFHEELKQDTVTKLQAVLSPEQIKKFEVLTDHPRGHRGHGMTWVRL